jgi:hypothetical protein
MDSQDLAKYIESSDGISKPWLLAQLRLKKLEERRSSLSSEQYEAELADIHQAVMSMGAWWVGIEDEEFGRRP